MTSADGAAELAWTFVAPSLSRPAGGLIALFELANAVARSGQGPVRVVHVPTADTRLADLTDLPWFDFDPALEHRFAPDLDPAILPAGDVVVYTTMLLATALAPTTAGRGRALVDALQGVDGRPGPAGLPVLFLQGRDVFPPAVEDLALRLPGPKVCVGSWLAELVRERGVPASEIARIPNGLDPTRFHIVRPVADRAPRVAMNFDPHPVKGGDAGLAALELVHERLGVPATVFGTRAPQRRLGPGLTFVPSPGQRVLAKEIYNETTVFLQPSRREGFGMCAVESMACGCALVTTANGGSADYALDGETALVCGPEAGEMADALVRLLGDDALRRRLVESGARFVERFRWPDSARLLADVARARLAALDHDPLGPVVDLDAGRWDSS